MHVHLLEVNGRYAPLGRDRQPPPREPNSARPLGILGPRATRALASNMAQAYSIWWFRRTLITAADRPELALLSVDRDMGGANAGDARRGNLTRPSRHAVGYAEPNQVLQPPRPARSPIGVRHEETTKPITQQAHQFRSRTSAWSVPRGTLESRWPPFSRSDQERHKSVLSRRRQRRGTPRHRVGLEYRIVGLTSEFLGVRLGHAAI